MEDRSPEPVRRNEEQGGGNERPHNVRFALADEYLPQGGGAGGPGAVPTTSISTAAVGTSPMTVLASKMGQMRVTEHVEQQVTGTDTVQSLVE